ncbi:cytidylyltransferase domain-containing protein [Vibrio campbellii]
MKNYAFIFARGGSKGLPGKNIKPLARKALLQYSIETAKACSSIS